MKRLNATRAMAWVLPGLLIVPPLLRAAPATEAAQPATRPALLGAGSHRCTLIVDGRERSYIVHVPPGYDRSKPTPLVMIFHGAWTDAAITVALTGMDRKADACGFIAVYPNGTGFGEHALFFNAWSKQGPEPAEGMPDDVKFTARMLDDLEQRLNVDPKRVFAAGISNGGMMCYRLAGELSDRIAAIASVAGTTTLASYHPTRPVPVLHFHGTADSVVPFNGPDSRNFKLKIFKSVDQSIQTWVDLDGCPKVPKTTELPDTAHDGTTVKRDVYGPGKDGAEVVLYTITGGGHTWPGRPMPVKFLGKSTSNVSANDVMWEFFCQHPMR
jgi:polyhydroxybutyrate depolymerase